jgi:hypothetical protein
MRRPDDLPVDLPVEWRQTLRKLAQLRSMEPASPSIALRREELRQQAAELQTAARTGETPQCQTIAIQPITTSPF